MLKQVVEDFKKDCQKHSKFKCQDRRNCSTCLKSEIEDCEELLKDSKICFNIIIKDKLKRVLKGNKTININDVLNAVDEMFKEL